MAHFYPNDYTFHSSPSDSQGFNAYPFQSQTPATEELDHQAGQLLAGLWGMDALPSVAGSWTGLSAAQNHELVAPAISYGTGVDGWPQLSYAQSYGHAVGLQAQPDHTGYLGLGTPSIMQEPPAALPGPSSVPLDYWEEDQSGPSTSAFDLSNAYSPHQYSSGPTRAELMSAGRFQPHGTHHARARRRRNAEAGPSTLVPSPAPYVGPPTSQPPGWIPETTADAGNIQTTTEEEETPVPERTRIRYGAGGHRPTRERVKGDFHRLCDWVQRWERLQKPPTANEALSVAVGLMPRIRPVVYQEPRLFTMGDNPAPDTGSARGPKRKREWDRRELERTLLRELSRYYWRERGEWKRPPLLKKVLKDLENLPLPPRPSDGPAL